VGTLAGSKSGGMTGSGIEVFDDIDEIACSAGSLGDHAATCGPINRFTGDLSKPKNFGQP
jgi:hypothetical protein